MNHIVVQRLKEKFGTKAVPTAELEMQGTPGILIGGEGEGIKVIAAILNITRIHNACSSISYARRGIAIARDYAARRVVRFHTFTSQYSTYNFVSLSGTSILWRFLSRSSNFGNWRKEHHCF